MTIKEIIKKAEQHLHEFIVGKRVIPPPYEVKRATIENYAQKFSLNTLIETGTYAGETVNAVQGVFSKIISIELDRVLFEKARERFENNPHISILHGDSSKLLPGVLASLNEPAVFWLDGHYSGTGTAKGVSNTPILSELETILRHQVRNHIILIDDARLFIGENGYPSIKNLFSFIRSTNGDMCYAIEDDIIRILPQGTAGHSSTASYSESSRQVASRWYRRLRQSLKQFFFGNNASHQHTRPESHTVS